MAAGFIHMIEEALRQFSALSQQTLPPLSKFSYRANLQNDGDSIPLSCEMLASAEARHGTRGEPMLRCFVLLLGGASCEFSQTDDVGMIVVPAVASRRLPKSGAPAR